MLVHLAIGDIEALTGGPAPTSFDQPEVRKAVAIAMRSSMRMVEATGAGFDSDPDDIFKWSKEPWVRIYRKDPPKWKKISVMARWLLIDLTRCADDQGRVALGQRLFDPGTDERGEHPGMCIPLRVPWQMIWAPLEELLDGHLVVVSPDSEFLVLPDFKEYQEVGAEPVTPGGHCARRDWS